MVVVFVLWIWHIVMGSISYDDTNKKATKTIIVSRTFSAILNIFCFGPCNILRVSSTLFYNVIRSYRWGRGHPEQYTEAINLGDERFDSLDSDKKPRAGQILWIRGLTRLQTQVILRCSLYNTYLIKLF